MTLDAEALQRIRDLVRGGSETRRRIIQILCEDIYAPGELDQNEVDAAVDAAIEELHGESTHWPTITDCDRLDAAFAAMRARKLVALQNAGYTQSDGYGDVMDLAARHPESKQLIGYCFYHGQDLERVIHGEGLYLAFGPIDPKQEQSTGLAVGRAIVEELNQVGLPTRWDGTFNQRIFIPKLNWQRRRAEGVVGEIAVGIREAVAGGAKLCATFVISGDDSRWVQFVDTVINAAYPRDQDPSALVAELGNAVVDSYVADQYVTVKLQSIDTLAVARWIDLYFREVLDARPDYSVDLELQWL